MYHGQAFQDSVSLTGMPVPSSKVANRSALASSFSVHKEPAAAVLAVGLRARVSVDIEYARIHAAVNGRNVRDPAPVGEIDQLIDQGIDRRDMRRPHAVFLLLPELRIAHPPVCHEHMIAPDA